MYTIRILAFISSLVFFSLGIFPKGSIASTSNSEEEMLFIKINKETLQAELRTWPEDMNHSRVLKSFPIAIGKQMGDKVKRGDNKTPEGIYSIGPRIKRRLKFSKYGPAAIPLSYPNPMDLLDNRTGYGIWLHGAGQDERMAKQNVTEGCVAFFNRHIKKLSNWLKPNQSFAYIEKQYHQNILQGETQKVLNHTKTWINAWQTRDLNQYIKMYSGLFIKNNRGITAYKRYKRRVFKSYERMQVKIDAPRALAHEKYAISIMNLDFNGDDRYLSKGKKILYWKKNSEQEWKIVKELFEKGSFKKTAWTEPDLVKLLEAEKSISH